MSVADQRAEKDSKQQGGVWETVKVIIEALLIALVFRTFLYHPFNIPSGSMEPTLLIGDYLFVSKFSYGYSRYSFPIDLSFIHGRIWEGEGPERGDIAVFRPPREPGTDYIKRVIGLPGDRIQVTDGVLYINDEAVQREPVGDWEGEDRFGRAGVPAYRETLPNGVSYITLDMTENGPGDDTRVFEVPPDHYFMMGDNRDNSQDSRFLNGPVGYVPAENLIGRAEIIFFSVEDAPAWAFWEWPWTVRPDRIFDTL
jgi:signal peptidase I